MFNGSVLGVPFAFVMISTVLLGSGFLLFAWIQVAAGRDEDTALSPERGLYAFTIAVLLDAALFVYRVPTGDWVDRHPDLWVFIYEAIISTSFALLIVTVFLSRRNSGILKIGSRVLFATNLLDFALLASLK